ncbi:hypothetical protein QVD17_26127 [Tagetes erecta]|uniref:Dienelactone hydrolase domain-containing protein n=1 Tax=Tagetes erecta TaxID=13708 RepID=A0AAD8K5X3_TARER|nr:hypothetical protein QVD17_26127 [Tagetes erecta]
MLMYNNVNEAPIGQFYVYDFEAHENPQGPKCCQNSPLIAFGKEGEESGYGRAPKLSQSYFVGSCNDWLVYGLIVISDDLYGGYMLDALTAMGYVMCGSFWICKLLKGHKVHWAESLTTSRSSSSMSGPECCENPPVISSGAEAGELLQIASLNAYVSGNPGSKSAVIFVSDVFGYEAPKLRQLADKVASAGYYAVVPDFFHGDPLASFSDSENWLKKHSPVQAAEFAKPVIQALKEKGITKIGAAGFCWGAKVVVELAKNAEIQVAALLHPSRVTLDDIKGVKIPIGIFGAEIDQRSPPELIKEFEAALVANEVNHFVKIYPGAAHGWTCRYNDEDEAAVKRAREAHQDLVDWFQKSF